MTGTRRTFTEFKQTEAYDRIAYTGNSGPKNFTFTDGQVARSLAAGPYTAADLRAFVRDIETIQKSFDVWRAEVQS